ncbi:hypothetical protein KRX51_03145 [Corynebacterium sp. TAE3-ERU12]|uniref:hypothetical protein n=1 Tax=Corynebacterium sp. TAE3-ERU12 TaxID=2849491 RepID=UPI001C481A3C|nr:hypothetical protein [Corynebacterium sp. TAE3-ERU12]MBV7294914.1 hypothetical protein [Corynebacterium sp. TAE3-ERU12]
MAWVRISDDALSYPKLLRVAEHPNYWPGARTEVFGFFVQMVTITAAHLTDGVVGFGEALMCAEDPNRAWSLIELCTAAGLMTDASDAERQRWELLNDPEFVGFKTAAEVTIDRQRKRDSRNPTLVIPVRYRDGDQCRYCAKTVDWQDRSGNRGATYDHRRRGKDITPEDLVVACRECNSRRLDKDTYAADEFLPLLPPPSEPWYSPSTRTFFARSQWAHDHDYVLPALSSAAQNELPLRYAKPAKGKQDKTVDPSSQPAAVRGSGTPRAGRGSAQQPAVAGPRAEDTTAGRGSAQQPAVAGPRADEHDPGGVDRGLAQQPAATVPRTLSAGCDQQPGSSNAAGRGSGQQPAVPRPRAAPSSPESSVEARTGASPPDNYRRSRSDLDPSTPVAGLSGTGRDGPGRAWQGRRQPAQKSSGRRRRR